MMTDSLTTAGGTMTFRLVVGAAKYASRVIVRAKDVASDVAMVGVAGLAAPLAFPSGRIERKRCAVASRPTKG